MRRYIQSANGSQKTVDLPAQPLDWQQMLPRPKENLALVNNVIALCEELFSLREYLSLLPSLSLPKVESVLIAARAKVSNLTVKQLEDLAFQKKQDSEVRLYYKDKRIDDASLFLPF